MVKLQAEQYLVGQSGSVVAQEPLGSRLHYTKHVQSGVYFCTYMYAQLACIAVKLHTLF